MTMARIFGGRSALAAGLFLLLACGAAPGAEDLRIEGEEFRTYGHHNIGGADISAEYCSGASQYLAADGIDVPGEWIRLKVTFPDADCYQSVIQYQAGYDEPVWLRVTLLDGAGSDQDLQADYLLVDGFGFG
jgi:hypothetical protein